MKKLTYKEMNNEHKFNELNKCALGFSDLRWLHLYDLHKACKNEIVNDEALSVTKETSSWNTCQNKSALKY